MKLFGAFTVSEVIYIVINYEDATHYINSQITVILLFFT